MSDTFYTHKSLPDKKFSTLCDLVTAVTGLAADDYEAVAWSGPTEYLKTYGVDPRDVSERPRCSLPRAPVPESGGEGTYAATVMDHNISPFLPLFLGWYKGTPRDCLWAAEGTLSGTGASGRVNLVKVVGLEPVEGLVDAGKDICPWCGETVAPGDSAVEYDERIYHQNCFEDYGAANIYAIAGVEPFVVEKKKGG